MHLAWHQLELERVVGEIRADAAVERLRVPRRRRWRSGWEQLDLPWSGAANDNSKHQPILVTAYGQTMTVYQWAAKQGMCAQTIYKRLASGYSSEACVSPYRPSRRADPDAAPGEPGSLSWDLLEWEEDPWAWRVIARQPMASPGRREGLLLGEVGRFFALSEQRVEEVEKVAARKLVIGEEIEDLLGWREAEPILKSLRGEELRLYERMLEGVRRRVDGRQKLRAS